MKTTEHKSESRRAFLKRGLRFLAGSGIIVSAATLALRDKDKSADKAECPLDIPCKGCAKFTGCNQSRAQKIKNVARGEGGQGARS